MVTQYNGNAKMSIAKYFKKSIAKYFKKSIAKVTTLCMRALTHTHKTNNFNGRFAVGDMTNSLYLRGPLKTTHPCPYY